MHRHFVVNFCKHCNDVQRSYLIQDPGTPGSSLDLKHFSRNYWLWRSWRILDALKGFRSSCFHKLIPWNIITFIINLVLCFVIWAPGTSLVELLTLSGSWLNKFITLVPGWKKWYCFHVLWCRMLPFICSWQEANKFEICEVYECKMYIFINNKHDLKMIKYEKCD